MKGTDSETRWSRHVGCTAGFVRIPEGTATHTRVNVSITTTFEVRDSDDVEAVEESVREAKRALGGSDTKVSYRVETGWEE